MHMNSRRKESTRTRRGLWGCPFIIDTRCKLEKRGACKDELGISLIVVDILTLIFWPQVPSFARDPFRSQSSQIVPNRSQFSRSASQRDSMSEEGCSTLPACFGTVLASCLRKGVQSCLQKQFAGRIALRVVHFSFLAFHHQSKEPLLSYHGPQPSTSTPFSGLSEGSLYRLAPVQLLF